MNNWLSIFIGGLISVMISFNSILAQHIGDYTSTVIIHSVGLVTILLIIILKKYKINFQKGLPLLLYSGGAIGVITVVSTNISMGFISATLTISLGLLGQVISSVLIDHYGVLGVNKIKFNKNKFLGLSLMILGIVIMTIY